MKKAGKAPARHNTTKNAAEEAREVKEREEELKILRPEICRELHRAVENKNEIHKRFVSEADLDRIWNADNRFSRFYAANRWPPGSQTFVRKHLIKILSILLYIRWDNWNNFLKSFIQHKSTVHAHAHSSSTQRDDRMLPVDNFRDVLKFLEEDHAQAFHSFQYIFCPVIINFGDWERYKRDVRLPIIPGDQIGEGAFAKVFKSAIAKGCYIDENDKPNLEKEIVAVKQYTAQSRHFNIETRRIKAIMEALRTYKGVVRCIGGFIQETTIGVEYNILYKDLADMNLEDFLRGPKHGYPHLCAEDHRKTEAYARAKPEDMLRELANLIDALSELHKFRSPHRGYFYGAHNDLKPDNILIVHDRARGTQQSSCGLWKISDFGLAEFRAPDDEMRTTEPVKRLLAPGAQFFHTKTRKKPAGQCSAPELAHSNGQQSYYPQLADIYSFGCILTLVLAYSCGEGPCNPNCGPCIYDCPPDSNCSGCDENRKCGPKMVKEVYDELEKVGDSRSFHDDDKRMKQPLYDWLRKLEEEHDKPWLSSCVSLIADVLHPTHIARPPARDVQERLDRVVELLSEGADFSENNPRPPRDLYPPTAEDLMPTELQPQQTPSLPSTLAQDTVPDNLPQLDSNMTEASPAESRDHAALMSSQTRPNTESLQSSSTSTLRPAMALSMARPMFSHVNNMTVENGSVEKLSLDTGGDQVQSVLSPYGRVVCFVSPKKSQPIKLHHLDRWIKSWHTGEPTTIFDPGVNISPEEGYTWSGVNLNNPYFAARSHSKEGNTLRIDNLLLSDLGFRTERMATDAASSQLANVDDLKISQFSHILLRKSMTRLWAGKVEKDINGTFSIKYSSKFDFARTAHSIAQACFSLDGKLIFSWTESQLQDEFLVYHVDNMSERPWSTTYPQDPVTYGPAKKVVMPLERGFIVLYLRSSYIEYAILSDFNNKMTVEDWRTLHGFRNATGEFATAEKVDALFFLAKSSNNKRRVMVSKIRKDEDGPPYLEHPLSSVEFDWVDKDKSSGFQRSSFIVRLSFKNVFAWVSLPSGVIASAKVGHYPPR